MYIDVFGLSLTASLAAALFALTLTSKGLRYTVLHPMPTVYLAFTLWFIRPFQGSANSGYADILCACSLLVFTSSAALVQRSRLLRGRLRTAFCVPEASRRSLAFEPARVLSSSTQLRLTVACGVLTVAYLAVASAYYGGLEYMLIRFRSKAPLLALPVWLRTFEGLWAGLLASIAAVMVADVRATARSRSAISALCLVLCYLIISIPTGSSGLIFGLAAVMFVTAAAVRPRKRGFRPLVTLSPYLVCLALVPLIPVLLIVRNVDFANGRQVFTAVADVFTNAAMDLSGSEAAISLDSYQRGLSEWVTYTIDEFDGSDYIWLYTPVTIAVNPVPRELWPDKPVGFGRLLAGSALRNPSVGPYLSTQVSIAASIAGEGYANGGLIGVLVMSVLIGIVSGAACTAYDICLKSGSYLLFATALSLRVVPLGYVRGDILSATAAFVYPAIVAVAIACLCRRCLPEGGRSRVVFSRRVCPSTLYDA